MNQTSSVQTPERNVPVPLNDLPFGEIPTTTNRSNVARTRASTTTIPFKTKEMEIEKGGRKRRKSRKSRSRKYRKSRKSRKSRKYR